MGTEGRVLRIADRRAHQEGCGAAPRCRRVSPRQRVLDIATGPGYVAAAALERGAEPVGIDIAEGMIEVARRENPEIEFIGDAEQMPLGAGEFDAVLANFVLNHLPPHSPPECSSVAER